MTNYPEYYDALGNRIDALGNPIAENPEQNPNYPTPQNPNVATATPPVDPTANPVGSVNPPSEPPPENIHGDSEGNPPDSEEEAFLGKIVIKGTKIFVEYVAPRTGHVVKAELNGSVVPPA